MGIIFFTKVKNRVSLRLLAQIRVFQVFWEPIKNRVSPRSALLKAVYLKALLYIKSGAQLILMTLFVYCHFWRTLFTKNGPKFQTLILNWALICQRTFKERQCLFPFNQPSVWCGSLWKIRKWCLLLIIIINKQHCMWAMGWPYKKLVWRGGGVVHGGGGNITWACWVQSLEKWQP